MVLRINKTAVLQYLLLYMMMLLNQSVLMDAFGSTSISVAVVVVCLVVMLLNKKYYNQKILISLMVFLGLFLLCRVLVGGVGIGIWLLWSRAILLAWITFRVDSKLFLTRMIKIVSLFACISLVLYVVSLINLEFVEKILPFYYQTRTNTYRVYQGSINFTYVPYYAYDGIVYVINEGHASRNCGIYTEPGIYQIILNVAVFVLCYMGDFVALDKRKQNTLLVILAATVISTQSTQGILVLAIILSLRFLIGKGIVVNKVTSSLVIGLVALFIDYYFRQSESIIGHVIVRKFLSDGSLSLTASTGAARIGTLLVCIESMLRNPFGVGYDRLMDLINHDVTGFTAASIFQTGAACGIGMFVAVLAWIFTPILRTNMITKKAKIAYVFLCITTFIYQSNEFYPYIVCIILFFSACSNREDIFGENIHLGEVNNEIIPTDHDK